MARDAAELKEVLHSVSNMLKPFYAQVILSSLQPPFTEYKDPYSMQVLKQQAGGNPGRAQHWHLLSAKVCCSCSHRTAEICAHTSPPTSMPPSMLQNWSKIIAPADLVCCCDH